MSMTLGDSEILDDHALGGKGTPSGGDGEGIGGGVYDSSVTLTISPTRLIAGDHASTEDDNIYP